jgi:hypothetical protein
VERAIDEAFVSGYRAVMLVAAAVTPASEIIAALLIEGKNLKVDSSEDASEKEVLAPRPLDA